MKDFSHLTVVIFTLVWCSVLTAQQKDTNHLAKVRPNFNIDAWEVLIQFNAAAQWNYGCEWDGQYFYSTSYASNLIRKHSSNGAFVQEFHIPGVSNLRDLAFDGTFMYGGNTGNIIYQMDFNSQTLIGTIPSPVGVRNIAYDEAADAFWIGSWDSNIYLVSRSGTTLATINTGLTSQSGTCCDYYGPAGPFIWVFDQGYGQGYAQLLIQYNITTGQPTGVTKDVMSDVGLNNPGAVAGGLFSMTDFASGWFTIGGVIWGGSSGDQIFVYNVYGNIPVELVSFTAEVVNDEVVLKWQTATETNNNGFEIQRTSPLPSPYKGEGGEAGRDWEKIGFVEGKGTTTETTNYIFKDKINEPGTYLYRLKQIDFDGSFSYSQIIEVNISSPTDFVLYQNYPNPFNPSTTIKFALPVSSIVKIKIYNTLGRLVETLVDKEMESGYHEVNFDASKLASGVYLYQLQAGEYVSVKKMILIK